MTDKAPGLTDSILPSDQASDGKETLLAGKYKTTEELENGYKNLVALLGKQGKVDAKGDVITTPAPPAEPKGIVPGIPEAAAAAKVVTDAGINYEALVAEYSDNGSLSEDTYNALAGKGIPKEMVDSYIAGQQALASVREAAVFAVVGGEDVYDKMIAWAGTTLTPAEKTAFNTSLRGDLETVKWAVKSLHAQYSAAVGKTPNLVHGSGSGAGTGGYESKAQLVADMKDVRYAKDPAFREAVRQKIARSLPSQ